MMKVKAKHWKLPSIKWGSFELLQKQHIAGDHDPCGVLMDSNNSPRQSVSHSSVHNKLKGAYNKGTYSILNCMCMCVCMGICVEARDQPCMSFLRCHSFSLFSEKGSLTGIQGQDSTALASWHYDYKYTSLHLAF